VNADLDAIFEHVLADIDSAIERAVRAVERADRSLAAGFADRLANRLADATSTVAALQAHRNPTDGPR